MSLPVLQIKRRNVNPANDYDYTGGQPNGLIAGELGYNYYNGTLWIGPNGDTDGRGYSILLNRDRRITAVNWVNGTVSGPTLKFTEQDQNGFLRDFPSSAIPSASKSQSGVVTTGAQTFAGPKTFVKSGNVGGITVKDASLDVQNADGVSALFASGPSGIVEVLNLKWRKLDGSQQVDESTSPTQIAHFDSTGNLCWVSPAHLVAVGISTGAGLTQDANTIKHINSITAGKIEGSSSDGLSFGGTINIPSITYDNTGHISSVATTSVKLPTISAADATISTAAAFVTGIALSATGKLTTTKFIGSLGGNDTFVYFNEGVPTAATENIGSSTKPVYVNAGVITEGNTYAGGTKVTLNGASKSGSVASFYAPTAAGSADKQLLVWDAKSKAPVWKAQSELDGFLTSVTFGGDNDDGRTLTLTLANNTKKTATIPSTIAGFSKITSNSFEGALTGNADTATKATQDASGNIITATYETKSDANAKLTTAKTWATDEATRIKNELLNGAGEAYDTLKELSEEIIANDGAIAALEKVAASKAAKTIKIIAGAGLTGGGTLEADRTIAHSNSVDARTSGTQKKATPGLGGEFTITEPLYDAQGHITGIHQAAITMPDIGTVSDDNIVNITATKDSTGNEITISASHADVFGTSKTYASSNATTTISGPGGTGIIKIPQISVNSQGHITAAADEEVTITMPSMTGSVPAGSLQLVSAVSASGATLSGSKKTLTAGTNIALTDTNSKITIGLTGIVAVANGGTGNETQTANRLIYSESDSKLSSSGHYATSSKLFVNSTTEDSNYTFKVNGAAGFTSGHIYLTDTNRGLVFGTPTTANVVLTATSKQLSINPSINSTEGAILLKIDAQSFFPGGINGGASDFTSISTSSLSATTASITTITGALNGNASSADKVNQTLSINNKTFDGSSPVDVGTIGVGFGGTGTATAPKQGGIIYGASTSAYGCTSVGNTGQYLISKGTGAPQWTNRIVIEVNPTSTPTEVGAIWITT